MRICCCEGRQPLPETGKLFLEIALFLRRPAPLDGSVELEILRSKTQARSDDKYTEAKSSAPAGGADFLACQSAPDVMACLESKIKQDPMFEGMRQRAAPCAGGPGL
jgi:hypothetical protein